MISNEEKALCLSIVRESIAYELGLQKSIPAHPNSPIFDEKFGLFVTLHQNTRLRGCIGYVEPFKDLYSSLLDLSRAAAFRDTRFQPVQKHEFESLHIEISILSPLYLVQDIGEIIIGRDGLLVKHPFSSGLLLPQVATEQNWDRETFLSQTLRKANLPDHFVKDKDLLIYRFEAIIFGESRL